MPYIAVSAGLIHTTQFHLPRTVATVLNQGLGYGFDLKIRVFMHWNEIQGCLVLGFSAHDSHFLCQSFGMPIPCRLTPQTDTNTIRIICAFQILKSRPYLSCFRRVVGQSDWSAHSNGELSIIMAAVLWSDRFVNKKLRKFKHLRKTSEVNFSTNK